MSAFGNQFAGAGTRTVLGTTKSHFILLLLELCFKLLDLEFIVNFLLPQPTFCQLKLLPGITFIL